MLQLKLKMTQKLKKKNIYHVCTLAVDTQNRVCMQQLREKKEQKIGSHIHTICLNPSHSHILAVDTWNAVCK